MGEIERDDHDQTRRDHGHQQRRLAVEHGRKHEDEENGAGEAQAQKRPQTAEAGDEEYDDHVDDRQSQHRRVPIEVDEDEVGAHLGPIR